MRYEDLVRMELRHIYKSLVAFEVPAAGGFIDAVISFPIPILVECKTTYCFDAYEQLLQYSRNYSACVRICVCETNDLSVRTPENPTFFRGLKSLEKLEPGYYVIPWTGKYAAHRAF